jgi:hypothetical protein
MEAKGQLWNSVPIAQKPSWHWPVNTLYRKEWNSQWESFKTDKYTNWHSRWCIYIYIYTYTHTHTHMAVGRDSSVGIATCYGPVGSASVQIGPGGHPATYTPDIGFICLAYMCRGVASTTHPRLTPGLKKDYSRTCTTLWAFMACIYSNCQSWGFLLAEASPFPSYVA